MFDNNVVKHKFSNFLRNQANNRKKTFYYLRNKRLRVQKTAKVTLQRYEFKTHVKLKS